MVLAGTHVKLPILDNLFGACMYKIISCWRDIDFSESIHKKDKYLTLCKNIMYNVM